MGVGNIPDKEPLSLSSSSAITGAASEAHETKAHRKMVGVAQETDEVSASFLGFRSVGAGKGKVVSSPVSLRDVSRDRIKPAHEKIKRGDIFRFPLSETAVEFIRKDMEENPGEHVYQTPQPGKEGESRREGITKRTIDERLVAKNTDKNGVVDEKSLAKDQRNLDTTGTIVDTDVMQSKRAEGDLEGFIETFQQGSFKDTVKYSLDLANGTRALHKADFDHGDVKPDNILVFKERGEGDVQEEGYVLKLTDFGKTRDLTSQLQSLKGYGGNVVNPPLEGGTSKEAGIGTCAIMMLYVLEATVTKDHQPLERPNPGSKPPPIGARRPIQKFLEMDPAFKHMENKGRLTVRGKARVVALRIRKWHSSLIYKRFGGKKQSRRLHKYIDKLNEKLKQENPVQKNEIDRLTSLLKQMTAANPKKRPSMEKVCAKLEKILTKITLKSNVESSELVRNYYDSALEKDIHLESSPQHFDLWNRDLVDDERL